MRTVTEEQLTVVYREEGLVLGEADGKVWLLLGERSFRLDDYPFEPCLYLKADDGQFVTVHHSFTVAELLRAAKESGRIRMITGNEYGAAGLMRLLRKAVELGREEVDIGYVEGRVFMDILAERGAVSPETAADLQDAGMSNPRMMNPLVHSKKVGETAEGRFYLRPAADAKEPDYVFRLISNQVRFGCGYRTVDGKRQYFAWHGYPSRNDDYITTAEISEREYREIGILYPEEIDADRKTAEVFRRRFVNGHPVLLEGWDRLL